MSCGCGCDGGYGPCGKGLDMGVMQVGSRGIPKPLTAGLGLGDIWSDSGMTDPSTTVSPDYSVINPSYTPAASSNPATLNLLSNLAASWTNTASQILKSNAGALPTYQQVGPGGSTTIYGNAGGIPSTLQTDLLSATMGSGSLIWIGLGAIVLMMMMKK